jgi:hypothetical protein
MQLILKNTMRYLGILLFIFSVTLYWSCEPKDPGFRLPNQAPLVRLANVPVNDPLTEPLDDTIGTDGYWKAFTDLNNNAVWDSNEPLNDDVGSDGLAPGDSLYLGPDTDGTQGNGKPNEGEPHVYPYRLSRSPIVSLYWVGNDGDGFVTGFAYRWTYKEKITDAEWKYNPGNPENPSDPNYKWRVIVNYVIPSSSGTKNLVLMMDLDTATAKVAAPSVFKFFSNAALDPERIKTDTALSRVYNQLDSGKTVLVNGYPVYASNPPRVQYPVHESPNSGTFVFESDDLKNRHIFEIVAIDNEFTIGRKDTINFWTPEVEFPILTITKDPGRDKVFVLKEKTYTWPGIRFEFRGRDRNSRTFEYSWVVDDTATASRWSPWSSDGFASVTALDMDTPYTGPHTFWVKCRNEFGAVTPITPQLSRTFNTVYPLFAEPGFTHRTIVIHASTVGAIDSSHKPNMNHLEEYYRVLMDSLGIAYDIWRTNLATNPRIPRYEDLARYSSIYLITDFYLLPPEGLPAPKMLGKLFYPYLDVGGRMVYNGIFTQGGLVGQVVDVDFIDSTLVKRMHLLSPSAPRNERLPALFQGAWGSLGYPDVQLDPAKIPPNSDAIRYVAVNQPRGFGEVIYRFDATINDSLLFENRPMGFRYDGITFKTVFFGFPMYHIKQNQAVAALRKAFRDIGELTP